MLPAESLNWMSIAQTERYRLNDT
jgi:hypothetical protein